MLKNSTKNKYTNKIPWLFILRVLKQKKNEKVEAFMRKKAHIFQHVKKLFFYDTLKVLTIISLFFHPKELFFYALKRPFFRF
jgi:hypothetical protein